MMAFVRPQGFGVLVRICGDALEYLTEEVVIELARAEASVEGYAFNADAKPRVHRIVSRREIVAEVTFPHATR